MVYLKDIQKIDNAGTSGEEHVSKGVFAELCIPTLTKEEFSLPDVTKDKIVSSSSKTSAASSILGLEFKNQEYMQDFRTKHLDRPENADIQMTAGILRLVLSLIPGRVFHLFRK